MTDRIKGFTVVLEHDIREDNIEEIKNALQMVKGVLTIQPLVANVEDFIIEQRVKIEMQKKIYEFIKKEF